MTPQSLQELMDQAKSLSAQDQHQQVIDMLTDEVLTTHSNADLYLQRAKAFIALATNEDKALDDLTTAVTLDPKNSAVLYQRGRLFYNKSNYADSIKDLEGAIAIGPVSPDFHLQMGLSFYADKQFDKALIHYNKVIELDPEDSVAYNNRGSVYDFAEQYETAVDDYTQAIKLNPHFAVAYSNRASTRNRMKDYDGAIEDCDRAIALNPRNDTAHFTKGMACHNNNMPDDAYNHYTIYIELMPHDAAGYNNRGNIWFAKKEYDKAIEDYSKAIETNPDHAISYSNKAHSHYNKGEFKKAITEYEKACSLDDKYKLPQSDINDLKLKIGEKVDLRTVIEGGRAEITVEFKSNILCVVIDYTLRLFLLFLYYNNQLSQRWLVWLNVGLFVVEFVIFSFDEKITKKVIKSINPVYKKIISSYKTNAEDNNRVLRFYFITGLIVSFFYFLRTSEHSHWYNYLWIVFKTLGGSIFFLFVAILAGGMVLKYKPISFSVKKITGSGKTQKSLDITRFFPDAIVLPDEIEKAVEVDAHDVNDTQIARLESDLKGINSKVDAYMLESVLLGALAFSGFLTIVASSIITKPGSHFLDMAQNFVKIAKGIFEADSGSISGIFNKITEGENLFLLIMFESLVCSVFFIMVLTLRLRFSDMSLKMDYLIRIMNIFNAKEEELVHIKLENTASDNVTIDKRAKLIAQKINSGLEDANKLLKEINPTVTLMSLYRNLGIITFYLILVTSGLYFSYALCLFILIIAFCTYVFRMAESGLKLDRIKGILKRH